MFSFFNRLNIRILGIGFFALAIIAGSLVYSNYLVKKLADEEKERMRFWAESQDFIWSEHEDYEECEANFLFQNVFKTNELIPTILVDSSTGKIIAAENLGISPGLSEADSMAKVQRFLNRILDGKHPPPLKYDNYGQIIFVYYDESAILRQLRFYPYLQIVVIFIFIIIVFLGFLVAKRSEQNKLWVGLAKETAHQLGTPVSSLMAWVELLQMKAEENGDNPELLLELQKDVDRLIIIVERFSKIGSIPELKPELLHEVIQSSAEYVRKRMSSKVSLEVVNDFPEQTMIYVNPALFQWVVENLLKNALDAIPDVGTITIRVTGNSKEFYIDIEDTGKGMPTSIHKKVFEPGFTTKKRGWGLGLSLTKRIVENYHKGKIFVKSSELGKGTTFRIVIPSKK